VTSGTADRASPNRVRFVVSLLVVVAVWPLLHRAGVAAWELNPWKLAGFAMYATHTTTLVVLLEPGAGVWHPLDERALAPAARQGLAEFRRQRDALGRLRSPREMARLVFETEPARAHLLVTVQRLNLEPATARIGSRKSHYFYERAEFER